MNWKEIKSLNYVSNWPGKGAFVDEQKLLELKNLEKLTLKVNQIEYLQNMEFDSFKNINALELAPQEDQNVIENLQQIQFKISKIARWRVAIPT